MVYTVWTVIEFCAARQSWADTPSYVHVMLVAATPFRRGVSVTSPEMFCVPEGVAPMIVKIAAVASSSGMESTVGVIVIDETVSTTVAVVVPLTVPEDAVMVVVPVVTPASKPPVEMVATLVSELDQQTVLPVQLVPPVRVPVLPSL
jgi:hypothetical protein